MATTIYDIAQVTGMSHGTVSRALNDNVRISQKTKQKVMTAARELGYRPTHAARSLKTGKTNTLGLVVPDFKNPFYTEFIRTAETVCLDRNYRLMPVEYALDSHRQRACLEQMLETRCDGVIAFFSDVTEFRDLLDEFWDKHIPCVMPFLDLPSATDRMDGTVSDVGRGVQQAVDYLVDLGHREIVMACSLPSGESTSFREAEELMALAQAAGDKSNRASAFVTSLTRHGLEVHNGRFLSAFSGDQIQDGVEVARMLLANHTSVTAVIAQNDLLAMGMMRTLMDNNVSVPGDISIVSCDDTWLSRYSPIPLTSISLETEQVAHSAVEIAFERMKEEKWDSPKRVFHNSELIVRRSTGPVGPGR